MESLWDSIKVVSTISKPAQWIVAITAIIALIFTLREQTLKSRIAAQKDKSDAEEKLKFENELKSTKADLAEAKILAENERIERERLEKAVTPRKINPDELAQSLSGLDGFTIEIHQLSDIETGLLVDQFKNAIRKTKCQTVDGLKMISTSDPRWLGVKIYGNINGLPLDDPLIKFVTTIRTHFLSHDIQIEWFNLIDKALPPKTIEMTFGKIPPINKQ